jgi:mannose/fructose/N-acetylgalactosamine-specific phosphotransferase system component IIC
MNKSEGDIIKDINNKKTMFTLLSIPAVIAAVEAIKMAGAPHKYGAIIAVFVGLLFGLIIGNWTEGLLIGLSASGLFSGVKSVLTK